MLPFCIWSSNNPFFSHPRLPWLDHEAVCRQPWPPSSLLAPCIRQAVEERLIQMRVEFLVVPSVNSVLPMWCGKFGYSKLSEAEHAMIEENIVGVS